jgi:hypothetical protein
MASVVSINDGNAARILQGEANHLGGIDDTGFDEILILVGGGIVAKGTFEFLTLSITTEPSDRRCWRSGAGALRWRA